MQSYVYVCHAFNLNWNQETSAESLTLDVWSSPLIKTELACHRWE